MGKRMRGVVLASVLATAFVPGLTAAGAASADEPLGTNGASVPELDWGSCGDQAPAPFECTTADVPLSYRDPDGPSITLALGKLPAKDQQHKRGTILYNPGGPGGSGQLPPELTPELRENFDIVGFDPRGIAASTGLRCFDKPAESERLLGGQFPITAQQRSEKIEHSWQAARACEKKAGPVFDHMSTANVARDMDLLRQAFGEKTTKYYGVSYGTHLGTVYANLFPDNVGKVVIDAVLDPVEWTTGERPTDRFVPFTYRLGSFDGAQDALDDFLAACESDARCAFHEEGADLRKKYDTLLDRVRKDPFTVEPGNGEPSYEVNYQYVVQGTMSALYGGEAAYSTLAETLQELYGMTEKGEVTARSVPRKFPEQPQPGFQQGGSYVGIEQGLNVMCSDTDNPRNPWAWQHYADAADEDARGFGSQWTYLSQPCSVWPASDPDRYTGPWDNRTANPVLVVGNRDGDPATPYDDAVSTSKRLADARLLTMDGTGHGALGKSACIDSAISDYFIDGTLPDEGTVCQPDAKPFEPEGPTTAATAGRTR